MAKPRLTIEAFRRHMLFGRAIQARRKKLGLKQKQLAHEAGVSVKAVYDWESGAHYPSLENQIALARAFGCGLHTIYHDFERIVAADTAMRTVTKAVAL